MLSDFLRKGHVLVVTRIDHLARSIRDLQSIVFDLDAKGVILQVTEQAVDTSTAAGKCFLDMLGVFSEFETNLRRERQIEGIAKANAAGKHLGRKSTIDPGKIQELQRGGLSADAVAAEMGISRASVYRLSKTE